MANPIEMDVPKVDARGELLSRLQNAPAEHAEALLAMYEVLQGLHDRGVLELARGALGSGDKLLDMVVTASKTPDSVRGIRNLVQLINMLSAIDPDALKVFTRALPEAIKAMVDHPERPGLWNLLRDFFLNQDFRHGMAAINSLFTVTGRSIISGRKNK